MARMLQIILVALLSVAAFAFAAQGCWWWIEFFLHTPVLGVVLDAAGQPIVDPANFDRFPYFSVAVVCGLCAMIVGTKPEPERFSIKDAFTATTLLAFALGLGVWLAS